MQYPGGKGKTYQRLINLMPRHQTYIETHLGGGAVMRQKAPAEKSIGVDLDPRVIQRWSELNFKHCQIVHQDSVNFLSNYSFTGEELVYSDPPYLPSTRLRTRVYDYDYDEDHHIRLLELLLSLDCMVMISGYDSGLYNDVLAGWRKISFNAKTHTGVREECVWMNFSEPLELHDARYLGDDFHQRQNFKRKQQRLVEKFKKMDSIERHHLLNLLVDKFGPEMEAL